MSGHRTIAPKAHLTKKSIWLQDDKKQKGFKGYYLNTRKHLWEFPRHGTRPQMEQTQTKQLLGQGKCVGPHQEIPSGHTSEIPKVIKFLKLK